MDEGGNGGKGVKPAAEADRAGRKHRASRHQALSSLQGPDFGKAGAPTWAADAGFYARQCNKGGPAKVFNRMHVKALGMMLALCAPQTAAQTSDTRPRFDVISVKPNTGADKRSFLRPTPDGISATNVVVVTRGCRI